LAASTSADIVWAQQDSGTAPELFAVGQRGKMLGRFAVDATNVDWEDAARGPDGTVLVGDIGNNFRNRQRITVYRVHVRDFDSLPATPRPQTIAAEATEYEWPQRPFDTEALLYDPRTENVFVVTKALDQTSGAFDPATYVYRLDAPAGQRRVGTMTRVAAIQLGDGRMVTGGDVSFDGSTIALRTYDAILVWAREEGKTVPRSLRGTPCEAPVPDEAQGEAIAFLPDGSLVTASEGPNPSLHHITPTG
jgi:hypothetical protein